MKGVLPTSLHRDTQLKLLAPEISQDSLFLGQNIKVDMKRKFLFSHMKVHEKQERTLLTVF